VTADASGGSAADAVARARATEVQATVLCVYEELKALLARDDLDPASRANLIEALAAVSLVVHDLALDYEMLYDLGV
jgi:hypothetical protein